MTVISTDKNRPHRMRRWAYAPLVATVAVGAVCTGAGSGSAATDAATDAVAESAATAPPPDPGFWRLTNDTDQPIYGTWADQKGGDSVAIDRSSWRPLQPGSSDDARIANEGGWGRTYWWAHVCYNHMWRNLNGFNDDFIVLTTIVKLKNVEAGALAAEFIGDGDQSMGAVLLVDNLNEPKC
ncbi:hypothetical protein [Rhodococcus jostii]|uniref:hypothetical protein n=1 Tax=Rhodococcus jostii TaxID=132919 RepID=UPI00363AB1D0